MITRLPIARTAATTAMHLYRCNPGAGTQIRRLSMASNISPCVGGYRLALCSLGDLRDWRPTLPDGIGGRASHGDQPCLEHPWPEISWIGDR